ncbi:ribosomal protein L7/L12 [Hyphomonas oceanitis]|uniref:ribosomal protein L7/L12 n=1 Tax=Hyphomonas oceanitis TaxID=81033 RepID=UPI0030035F8B
MAMIDKLSDPVILFALVLAFVLGFLVRGNGRSSLSPAPMNQEEIDAAMKRVTVSRWMDIDAEIAAGRKLAAIKMLRESTGLGLKNSKEAVEARMASRGMTRH